MPPQRNVRCGTTNTPFACAQVYPGFTTVSATDKEIQEAERKLEAGMIEEEYSRRREEKTWRKPDLGVRTEVSEAGRKLMENVAASGQPDYNEQDVRAAGAGWGGGGYTVCVR